MRVNSKHFIRLRIARIVAVVLLSFLGVLAHAQTAADITPEWQKAAGGKLSFDAASIKLGDPAKRTPPSFALDYLDSFGGGNPHGRFVGQFALQGYIAFAYKLFPYSQEQKDAMLAHVPKWVSTDQYVINAEAEGNRTKDQMRLMIQSLLADRFKLSVHFERIEVPVFALVLDKLGKTGPKLHPHSDGVPCDVSTPPPDTFPPVCDSISATDKPNNAILIGARNLTMKQIAAALIATGRLTRQAVDQSGLDGRFDFTLEWIRESNNPGPIDLQEGTTFQEALQEQLGLKFTKATMDTLVIDHVERPTEN